MSSESTDPPPGTPDPEAPRHDVPPPSSPPSSPGQPSSNDELSRLLAESMVAPQSDPLLGPLTSGERPASPPVPSEAPVADVSDEGRPSERFDVLRALIAFNEAIPVEPVVEGSRSPTGSGPPAGPAAARFDPPPVDGGATSSPGSFHIPPPLDPGAAAASTRAGVNPSKEDEEAEDELPTRGMSWPWILLLSYASAVTIALIWVLIGGRRLREAVDEVPPTVNTTPDLDPGRRADQSRRILPPPPIASDHMTTLGKPLRLGALEVTPLEIGAGRVELKRTFTTVEQRDGGDDALKLKLRLANVSTDTIFSPLDEAFVRERERGILDTLIETSDGRQIAMFPLAVTSEWSIVGQEFRALKPGESYETSVVSVPDALGRTTADQTWRVRLRTGIHQTDTIGIRFRADQIQSDQ